MRLILKGKKVDKIPNYPEYISIIFMVSGRGNLSTFHVLNIPLELSTDN